MKETFFQGEEPFRPDPQDSDILRKQSGGWHLLLFGVSFFLTGLLATLTGLEVIPNHSAEFDLSSATALGFGVIFMGIGMVITFGRSELTIDRRRKQITLWYGILVPMKRITRSLDLIEAVGLGCSHSGKKATYTVDLRGGDIADALTVERTADYRLARQTAKALSLFVGKPILEKAAG